MAFTVANVTLGYIYCTPQLFTSSNLFFVAECIMVT